MMIGDFADYGEIEKPKTQSYSCGVIYSNGQISVTKLFYFMTGDDKKFGGSIKDLYKKFMGEDLFY